MNAQELVENVDKLVSLPEVCVRINQVIDSPTCSSTDIGEILAEDADLTARLLRTVNSAFYGIPSPIDTISRAITVIGTHDLRDLVFMTSACQLFSNIPGELVNMNDFWQVGVSTGVIARTLGRKCNILHAERLFVQGVLHDIGRLVIYRELPELARDILLVADGSDDVQTAAEQDILGFTHAEVGYALLSRWRLPEAILTSVRYHHEPADTMESHLEVALIHMASIIANETLRGGSVEEALLLVDPFAWQVTGFMDEEVESALGLVTEEVDELLQLMFAQPGCSSYRSH